MPVRRTALFVEASIEKGTTWAVVEPNEEPLWQKIRRSVENVLHSLFLKCGRDTVTGADQAAGIVNIQVGIAPLKPAEFLILHIRQKARPKG